MRALLTLLALASLGGCIETKEGCPAGLLADADPDPAFASYGTESGHVHELVIHASQLASAGFSYRSSVVDSHDHEVALTAADHEQIRSGATLTVVTSDEHTHRWEIAVPGDPCGPWLAADAVSTASAHVSE